MGLIVAVCVVTMVLPNLNGRESTGSPVAMVLPAPPVLGSCAVAFIPEPAADRVAPGVARAPAVRFGRCSEEMLGEVVSVDPKGLAAVPTYPDQLDRGCRGAADAYLGPAFAYAIRTESTAGGLAVWHIAVGWSAVHVWPTALERAAGRTWSACLIVAANGRPYRGTVAEQRLAGSIPDEFGVCTERTWELSVGTTSCADPHPMQLMGETDIMGAGLTDEHLHDACVDVAKSVTGAEDPTAGGELRVVLGARSTPDAQARCYLVATGERMLDGSLIGLGDGPVPWAE